MLIGQDVFSSSMKEDSITCENVRRNNKQTLLNQQKQKFVLNLTQFRMEEETLNETLSGEG